MVILKNVSTALIYLKQMRAGNSVLLIIRLFFYKQEVKINLVMYALYYNCNIYCYEFSAQNIW